MVIQEFQFLTLNSPGMKIKSASPTVPPSIFTSVGVSATYCHYKVSEAVGSEVWQAALTAGCRNLEWS